MANELQELRDLVAQLRSENDQLQDRAAASTSNTDGSTSQINPNDPLERLVYIPRERKCPFF